MRLKPRRRVVVPAKPVPEPAPLPTQDLDEAWTEVSALYANRKGMKLSRMSWAGLPERLLPDRISKLLGTSAAKRTNHLLALLSDQDLRVFHARAAIGLEQAVAAMRLFLVFNVSGPVGIILLITNVLPADSLGLIFSDRGGTIGMIVATAILMPFIVYLIWYAFAGVHQARDLYHLATLEMARRGLAAGIGGGDLNAVEAKP